MSRPGLYSIVTSEVISALPGVAKMQLAAQSSVTDPEVRSRSLSMQADPCPLFFRATGQSFIVENELGRENRFQAQCFDNSDQSFLTKSDYARSLESLRCCF